MRSVVRRGQDETAAVVGDLGAELVRDLAGLLGGVRVDLGALPGGERSQGSGGQSWVDRDSMPDEISESRPKSVRYHGGPAPR